MGGYRKIQSYKSPPLDGPTKDVCHVNTISCIASVQCTNTFAGCVVILGLGALLCLRWVCSALACSPVSSTLTKRSWLLESCSLCLGIDIMRCSGVERQLFASLTLVPMASSRATSPGGCAPQQSGGYQALAIPVGHR